MAEMDYAKIGLKAGIEIHQQLDTGKLFCKCPGYLRKDEPDFVVRRKLHKVAGESGEVDSAVEYEANLDKEFIYQGYNDNVCLVELDEEPPHMVNEEALNEVLKIALLLNCEIYPVMQVMRKTVINGSNTSGFQRTVLIAHSGKMDTSFGEVNIDAICLEEEAARIISKDSKKAIYRLDRLGIPLVEIATASDMKNPEQVKEVALKIGEIVRACRVKRGIGTIRQDVNVSIKGHDRVEIKGFQDPSMMIKTVQIEAERQLSDLKKNKKGGEVRNSKEDGSTEFLRPMPGKSRMYPETDLPLLKIGREKINEIKKVLPKMKHEIREDLRKKGLSEELINLVLEGSLDEFEVLLGVYNKDANLVAKMVTLWRNEFASKMKKDKEIPSNLGTQQSGISNRHSRTKSDTINGNVYIEEINKILSERVLEKVLEELKSGKIEEGDVRKILEKIVNGEKIENALKIEKVSHDDLEEEISKIIKEKPGMRENAYMGLVMQKLKGKVDARKAMEIIKKVVEKNG